MKKKNATKPVQTPQPKRWLLEAEVVLGLEALAASEITRTFSKTVQLVPESQQQPAGVRFWYQGALQRLESLHLVQALYAVNWFDIPRPKALLGNTEFRIIRETLDTIVALAPREYRNFHLSAAGSDSAVMRRFAQAIQQATNLTEDENAGDLWLRVRRGADKNGWELLTRIGNRPLATRSWRICNFEGALNATVAHAMVLLSNPTPEDRVVNLACGSGSILVERKMWGPSKVLLGVDRDEFTLKCASLNLSAAHVNAALLQADVRQSPLDSSYADVIVADLPFGKLSGSHAENVTLYPAVLTEAARIAKINARLVLITHEIRLIQSCIAQSQDWILLKDIQITLRGLHPHIYVLQRRSH